MTVTIDEVMAFSDEEFGKLVMLRSMAQPGVVLLEAEDVSVVLGALRAVAATGSGTGAEGALASRLEARGGYRNTSPQTGHSR